MPQLIKGQSFADGDLVTGLTLNNIIDLATLSPTSITSQTAVTTFDIESSDYFLIYDSSASALRKASVDDIFRSGQTVKFSAISGIAGSDLAVAIASGFSFIINGNTSIPANLTVTGLVQGGTGKFTTELTIPAGATATRPASPIAGSVRFNTDTGFTEVWNGTAWTNSSILATANTFTAKNTFSNVVDVTGALKVNDRVGFVLYDIYEEDIPLGYNSSSNMFNSLTFSKPLGEIWVFEIEANVAGGYGTLYFYKASGTFGANANIWYKAGYYGLSTEYADNRTWKWILGVNTSASTEQVKVWASTSTNATMGGGSYLNTTGPDLNKFRIYKYKTASNLMLTGKAYINNGTSVTVTSTAHGLTAGQYVNIWATNPVISGRWVITSAATDTFIFANPATAGSGTLAYIA